MTDLFIPAILLFLTAGLIPLCTGGVRSWWLAAPLQAGAGILTMAGSLVCLFSSSDITLLTTQITPLFPVILGADRLTGTFAGLLGILAIAVSLYTPGYVDRMHSGRRNDILCALIPFFLASMLAVLLSRTTIAFLITWELMAIISFFLVLIEYNEEKTRRAAFFYLVMTQLSTVCLFLAIVILFVMTGSFAFPSGISTGTTSGLLAFILLFLGIAIKSGVIPFHKWLPHAHPAAASPVSALMSGMMLNTALYMLLRAVTGIFVPGSIPGTAILLLGCLTAVLGVMYALKEEDLKGLLAYSSIDNTGVILIGAGLFCILIAAGESHLAEMALLGTLFHAISHGLFKGLLFLTAGSVCQAAGTRNIDELGGILVRMPRTGALFFIGMAAVCALPPLNGFAGELLIYQALILGIIASTPLMQVVLLIALALFGLCSALTAVCFVKAFGLTFLALPRTGHARKAREVPLLMQAGPAILAVACLITGVCSAQILTLLGFPGYLPDLLVIALLLVLTGVLVFAAVYAGASRQTRVAITWGCGLDAPTNRMEYTGSGFTQPVVRIFSPVYRTRLSITRQFFDGESCFMRSGEAEITLMKFFEEYLYLPMARAIDAYAARVAGLQNGSLDRYVLYVFLTVIALILIMTGVL